MVKIYRLLGPDGKPCESSVLGDLGGNSKARIYGKLTCPSANAALVKGYARHRVFFSSEEDAIAAGYRPCGRCMRAQYARWNIGGVPGSVNYPWLTLPK